MTVVFLRFGYFTFERVIYTLYWIMVVIFIDWYQLFSFAAPPVLEVPFTHSEVTEQLHLKRRINNCLFGLHHRTELVHKHEETKM